MRAPAFRIAGVSGACMRPSIVQSTTMPRLPQRSDHGLQLADRLAGTRRAHRHGMGIARGRHDDVKRPRPSRSKASSARCTLSARDCVSDRIAAASPTLDRAPLEHLAERVDPFAFDAVCQHAKPRVCARTGFTDHRGPEAAPATWACRRLQKPAVCLARCARDPVLSGTVAPDSRRPTSTAYGITPNERTDYALRETVARHPYVGTDACGLRRRRAANPERQHLGAPRSPAGRRHHHALLQGRRRRQRRRA